MSLPSPSSSTTPPYHGPFPKHSTSLSLLLPQKPTGTYAHQSLPSNPTTNPAVREALQRSHDLVDSFNARDFSTAMSYAHPRFKARHNNLAVELNREQHFAAYKMMLTMNPSWRMDIIGEHAEVDVIGGQAYVWFFVKISGDVDGVTRDSLGLLHWERDKDGVWLVVYHWGFRSCGMLF